MRSARSARRSSSTFAFSSAFAACRRAAIVATSDGDKSGSHASATATSIVMAVVSQCCVWICDRRSLLSFSEKSMMSSASPFEMPIRSMRINVFKRTMPLWYVKKRSFSR